MQCLCLCVSVRIQTLHMLRELERTGYGRPRPRHGRPMLDWFLGVIPFYNNNLYLLWARYHTDFGFHFYMNRENIVPRHGLSHYVLGNLRKPGARNLPKHIWRDHTGLHDDSNKDRIIVGVNNYGFVCAVYITEHYRERTTYLISENLGRIISQMNRNAARTVYYPAINIRVWWPWMYHRYY